MAPAPPGRLPAGRWRLADYSPAVAHIHLLSEITDQGRTITTGCGETRTRRQTDTLPADVTGWGSSVTCPVCLARQPTSTT